MIENILLEKEQKELLCNFVEAVRKVPRQMRERFYVLELFGGTKILHPGLEGEENTVYIGDVEALGRENLIAITHDSKGNLKFDVTPLGFKYYDEIKKIIIEGSVDRNRIDSFKHLLHEVVIKKHNMGKAVLWHELANRLPAGVTDFEIQTAITELVEKNYIIFEPGPGVRTRFIAGSSFSVWPKNSEGQESKVEGKMSIDGKKVFVVHGRNENANEALFQFLRAIGLNPIEWSQAISLTGKSAPYIGEVLDAAFSNAQAIVVLLTGDDLAKLRDEFVRPNDPRFEKQLTVQARPNVLFEAGMALGRHNDRTVIIELGELRPFTDISGRHLIKLDDSTTRRQELAQRLKTAGCDVDLTGTQWHKAGKFVDAILVSPKANLEERRRPTDEPCGFESVTIGSTMTVGLSKIPNIADGLLISVEQNTIRFRLDGNDPTSTEGTILNPGDSIKISNRKAIENFKAIAISGAARLQIHYFL